MVKRLLQVLALVGTLLVGASAAVVIVTQTSWFRAWLRGYIVAKANDYVNGQVSIGRLGGNLFFGAELGDLELRQAGQPVVRIKELGLDYSVLTLASRGLVIDDVRLDQPVIHLRKDAAGWNVASLVKRQEQEADRQGPGSPVTIGSIGISDGSVSIDDSTGTSGVDVPSRIDRLDAKLAFSYAPVNYTIDIDHVSFRGDAPAFALNALSGRISTHDDALYFDKVSVRTAETSLSIDGALQHYLTTPALDLSLSADKVSLPELARVVPALRGYTLQPALSIKARGPLDQLRLDLDVRSSAGRAAGVLVADVTAPERRIAGTVQLQHLDLAPLLRDPAQRSDITGNAKLDLALDDSRPGPVLDHLVGTYRVEATRVAAFGYDARDVQAAGRFDSGRMTVDGSAAAYGTRATVSGWIAPSSPLAMDVRGRATHLDLRRLPASLKAPALTTDVTAGYHVAGTLGRAARLVADVTLDPSTVAGATIEGGSTARVTITGATIGYQAHVGLRGLDLQRFGQGLHVAALSTDRFASTVNGQIDAQGSGTSLEQLALTARSTLVDSRLFGGQVPRLAFDATVADQALRVTANGSFAGFDPAALSGNASVAGAVGGQFDIRAEVPRIDAPMTADAVRASGSVSLGRSRVGPLVIDEATVAGEYANSAGRLDALHVLGPDVSMDARGRVDLSAQGTSDVSYTLNLVRLAPVATLIGQPLSGAVSTEGRLTGPANALAANGTLALTNVRYGGTSVLASKTTYAVRIPDLQPASAAVTADTTASLVHVAGRDLTQVHAQTTWAQQTLGFDASLRDQDRSLAAKGDVTLHPDHQEIHLRDLVLAADGIEWRTAPGAQASVQYGADRVAVEGLQLVGANGQQLRADGAFGRPGDRLVVTAQAIDLALADRLALANQGVAGRLDLNATIAGRRDAPDADARFTIVNGAFRDFKYQSFNGAITYGPSGLRLDTRLEQTPANWIAVKGIVPPDAFQPASGTPGATGHETAAPGHELDLRVTSSPLDLSLVQGFVSQVSRASGQLQADLHVTNTIRDPHIAGYVAVRNGALAIADLTDGGYTGLNTRIAFEPDRVRIEDFSILDEHKHALRIGGQLGLHAREIGAVQVAITADQFEVIDNDLGEVRVNTDLRIGGELRAPRVEGDVSVHSASIDLARVLDLATSDAYATRPIAVPRPTRTGGTRRTATGTAPTAAGTPETVATAAAPTTDPRARAIADARRPIRLPSEQRAATTRPAIEPVPPLPEPGLFDALALAVRLRLPNNFVIKGTGINPGGSPVALGDVNLTIGGDVRATKDPGAPMRLVGTVNTVRGTYDFQGRRFDIARDGTIQFLGSTDIDPRLDLLATRLISGVEARVHVQGTARQPKLTLTSNPPLEEADILSLIIFNQPANTLGEGEQVSLAARASALATGFVASSLAQSIGKSLDLDVFEIQTTPESGGSPTVTVGQQVGERLFLKFRQAFGAQSVSEFLLEYQLAEFLRLQSSVAQGSTASQRTLMQRFEQGSVDLIFFFTY